MARKRTLPEIPAASSFAVELWPIDKLEEAAADYNPRFILDTELRKLVKLIKKFGFLLPVVVNSRSGRMVGGHQRLKAAKKLAMAEIPVHLVDLDDDREKALNLALNKIEGRWDYGLLENALSLVSEAQMLEFSGFTEADVIEAFAAASTEYEETFDEFAGRMQQGEARPYITFQSDGAKFSCSREDYELLVQRIYGEVGINEEAATDRFFEIIGLGDTKPEGSKQKKDKSKNADQRLSGRTAPEDAEPEQPAMDAGS